MPFTFKEQRRVLVVEDDPNTSVTIVAMLDELGFKNIKTAQDGREALAIIDGQENLFDLIFCDWNMPNMTGLDFLKQLRTVNKEVPFLMVTARGDVESVQEAIGLGVTGYIRKPVSLDEIEKKVRKVLNLDARY